MTGLKIKSIEDEMKEFVKAFAECIQNPPIESRDEYLVNLPKYKDIIDRSPNKFLLFHLKDAMANGRIELANYIKQTIKLRYQKAKI